MGSSGEHHGEHGEHLDRSGRAERQRDQGVRWSGRSGSNRRHSASWLSAVEGFFSALTRRRLRRGTFTGIVGLQATIKRYIAEHNQRARPFVWTKPAAAISNTVNQAPEPFVCVTAL